MPVADRIDAPADPWDLIDDSCPVVQAFAQWIRDHSGRDAEGLEADGPDAASRGQAFARDHKAACVRCRMFVGRAAAAREDRRVATWIGGPLGLAIGLVAALVTGQPSTVLYCGLTGAALSLLAGALQGPR